MFNKIFLGLTLFILCSVMLLQSCAPSSSIVSSDTPETMPATNETQNTLSADVSDSNEPVDENNQTSSDSVDENVPVSNRDVPFEDVSPKFKFEDWNTENSEVNDSDKFDFYMKDYYYYDGFEGEVDFVVKTDKTEDFEYRVLENQKIAIDRYIGKDKRVYVPSQIEGKDVIGLGTDAFRNNKTVEYINLPNTVVHISWFAFNRCSNLKEVVFSDGLVNIGASAFARCTSLKKINIPDSVVAIGSMAFYYCKSLTELDVSNVSTIGNAAFAECWSLEKVKLSDELETIETDLFEYCKNLYDVNVPKNLKYIYDDAFDYTKVDVDKFYAVAEKKKGYG